MFRLLEAGLPKGPVYLPNFKDLGYFINDEDEIRSIEDPLQYFHYFATKNERFNNLQRHAMNTAVKDEVLKRLEARGLRSTRLPLGVSENDPHTTILTSSNLQQAKRVIVLFCEHTQDLGVFAHRIIGGRGGINKGSAACLVDYIQSLPENPRDESSHDTPGIILANIGQLRWWRKGKQAITQMSWYSLPRQSAVHPACRFDEVRNVIPQNRNTREHIAYMFNEVFSSTMLHPEAKLEIIGVGDGAHQAIKFLNVNENWDAFQERLGAIALLAPYHILESITNPELASWLQKRGRAYVVSSADPTTVLAASAEPENSIADFGCPTFSLGERYYSEALLPRGYKIVLDFFQEVAAVDDYENPNFVVGDISQVDTSIPGYGGRFVSEKTGTKIVEHPTKSLHVEEASVTRNVGEISRDDKCELQEGSAPLIENRSDLADTMQVPITRDTTNICEAEIESKMAPTGELVGAVNDETMSIKSDAQKSDSKPLVGQHDQDQGKENADALCDIIEGMSEANIQE